MKIIKELKMPFVLLVAFCATLHIIVVLSYVGNSKDNTIFINYPISLVILCALLVCMYIIGRFSVRDEIESMKKRVNKQIDGKFQKLVDFTNLAKTLVNNDVNDLIAGFLKRVKDDEDITGEKIK